MSELGEELDRLDFDYGEELIEVTPYYDISNLRFDGIHYNLIADRIALIPYWIAEILQEHNLVEMKTENSDSFHQIKGLTQSQRASPQIIALDDLTFRMFLKEIDNLRLFSNNVSNVFKLKSIENNFNQLLEIRTNKLLEMVRTDQKMNNKNLTSEEDWFFNRLNHIYSKWKKSVGKQVDSNYTVKVQALTDLTDIPYDVELKDNPNEYSLMTLNMKENEEQEIPLLVAEVLRDHRLVTITSSGFIDQNSLSIIVDEERRTEGMLTKIDPLLYHFLIEEIERLEGQNKSIHNLSKLSEYQGSFNFILRIRIRKILKHITDQNSVDISNIIFEEKVLYDDIKRIYNDWQYLMAGEEEIPEPEFEEIQEESFTHFQGDMPSEWQTDPDDLEYLRQLEQVRESGANGE